MIESHRSGDFCSVPNNAILMRRTADRLFGGDYVWSVLAAGRHQMPLITQAALLGGNVRVGLEDSLHIGRGRLASSNAEQVKKIAGILEDLGFEIAFRRETRGVQAAVVPRPASGSSVRRCPKVV
jgi:uncharacterized protein (DUF849 family)